jgi:general secretion pathway protein F
MNAASGRATYRYRALDAQGGELTGALEADNEKDAFDKLAAKDLSPFEITPMRARRRGLLVRAALTRADLSRYLRQLATLLSANVTALDALTTLSRGRSNPLIAARNQKILFELRGGKRLSAALETHLGELPGYVFRLAELGEATGSIAKALTDAADRMAYEDQVNADIRAAMTYPMFLLSIGGGIVALMFLFVVPRFATLMGDDLSKAPWISQVVINTGLGFRANWPLVLMGVAAGAGALVFASRKPQWREAADGALRSLPLVGAFLHTADLASWCRTVAIAVINKAQLVDALRLAEDGARSARFRRQLTRARALVRAGRSLDEALLEADPDFDPMVLDLIRTGRSAGALGEMLAFSAGLFEKDAREKTKQLTTLAEPVAIVAIAVIVAVIVISIVLAMTSLYELEL